MTIAKRLALLLAVPLFALFGLGIFVANQIVKIERLSRFVAEKQIGSLGDLGHISRRFAQDRICVRNYLLAQNKADLEKSKACIRENETELDRLLSRYGDALVSSDTDRRLYNDFRYLSREWASQAQSLISLSEAGKRDEAAAQVLAGRFADVGERATSVLNEWTEHNVTLSSTAANSTLTAISNSGRNMLIAVGIIMLLSGTLGFFTFRRIVYPVRALQVSVERIASGTYTHSVPFTTATDETGALARSIDVLRKGAAAREEQRWVKASIASITNAVQGAASRKEFGKRLLSELVPMLGGGVAALYTDEAQQLVPVAGYGIAETALDGHKIPIGTGLVGQCARDRAMIVLAELPPEYLRVSSGLGGAPPKQTMAWPLLSGGDLVGVLEFASFSALTDGQKALMDELVPAVAMSLKVLSHSLATQQLLVQTQEQATRLEEQNEAARRRSRYDAMHSEVATALVQEQDFATAMGLCANAILRGVDTVFSRIWMLDPETDTLVLCASAGLYTN